jgi:hypothetical protein
LDHPFVGVVLAQTRHTLEEIRVDGSYQHHDDDTIGKDILTLLKTLKWLEVKISTIEMISCSLGADFDKVAGFLAKNFTDLRHLRFPYPRNEGPSRDAGVEVILRACSNLESFECTLCQDYSSWISFRSGDLHLKHVTSQTLAHAASQCFGKSITSLRWTSSDTIDDDAFVHVASMCSKLKTLKLKYAANVTDEGIIRALPSLPLLTAIKLSGCDQLTVAGLRAPLERCKLLQRFRVCHAVSVSGSSQCSYYHLTYDSGDLHIQYDSVRSYSLLRAALQRFGGTIIIFDCTWPEVSDDGLCLMTSMCCKLQRLSLHDAKNVTDEGIIGALSPLLVPHLTSISLSGCDQLTVAGLKAPLERCRSLQRFEVDNDDNSFSGSSQKRFYSLLYDCGMLRIEDKSERCYSNSLLRAALQRFGGTITSIDCTWPEVSDDGLCLMTSMCCKLQRMKLKNAKNVTDEGIIGALSPLLVPHLTSISLCGCDQLTVAGLQALIGSRWPLPYFKVERDMNKDVNKDWQSLPYHLYCNALTFDEGVITGKGDFYWPLVEVFSCRQRDALKAIGDRLPP